MKFYPIFLTVVFQTRDKAELIEPLIRSLEATVSQLVSDYEIIVIDNASSDDSIRVLKEITKLVPNVQVFALTKEVHEDVAAWVGLENSLGDFAIVVNPETDDLSLIDSMINEATSGKDVVFGLNSFKDKLPATYGFTYRIFRFVYRHLSGLDLATDAPSFRLVSKKVINYLLQFSSPANQYRFLPATAGFSKQTLIYSRKPKAVKEKSTLKSLERGMELLVSTTKAPMRLVTTFSLFGAFANLIYSVYVLWIAFFKVDVAPGWVTLSLQQSGMFFLLSIVLYILGEYILHMAKMTNEGPVYHIAQEYTSTVIKHRQKLNIEESTAKL